MKSPVSLPACFALALSLPLAAQPAQTVLSLDETRTGDALISGGDDYLTSPKMIEATQALQGAGYAISTGPSFDAASIAGFDVLFTGLVDVGFTAAELDAVEAYVLAGGGLFVLRDWGPYYVAADPLLARFGVTYDTSASGIGGTVTDIDQTMAHPIWSGPAGNAASFGSIYSASVMAGAVSVGVHETDGKSGVAVLEYGAGRILFSTDAGSWNTSGGVAPLPNTDTGVVWLNIFAWLSGGGGLGTPYCVAAANSASASGAMIQGSGSESLSAANLTLKAELTPNQPGLFYFGDAQTLVPFGDGFRCVSGTIIRMPVLLASGNLFQYSVDFGAYGGSFAGFGTVYFQCWFRDPLAGGTGFNLSDGLEVTFVP